MNIRIPHSWLRDYCAPTLTPKEIAAAVSLSGPSIDRVEKEGDESIYDAEITTNRPDAFSLYGFAREVGVITKTPFTEYFTEKGLAKHYAAIKKATVKNAAAHFSIQIDNPLCRRYAGVMLDHIAIGPSPAWMQERLRLCGQRAINNVVDITNYVMLELGQPLHAFDAVHVGTDSEKKIIVRSAKKGEKFTTLDGQERGLDSSHLVIADQSRALALAGIKGGSAAGISEHTTSIILESANFDPVNVRTTSRLVDIRTDSSLRYEKNLSPEYVPYALVRAIELLQAHAGARIISNIEDAYPKKEKEVTINFDLTDIRRILGVDVSKGEVTRILKALGFAMTPKEQNIAITVPFWRRADMADEGGNGIVEEVARIRGYADLVHESIRGPVPLAPREQSFVWERDTKHLLRDLGWAEIMTYSFVNEKQSNILGENPENRIKIHNPLTVDFEYMRPSLASGILETLAVNEQKKEDVRIFELSRVYSWISGKTNQLPNDEQELCGAIMKNEKPEILFRMMKGAIDVLLNEWFGAYASHIAIEDVCCHPTRLSHLYENGRAVRVTYGPDSVILGSYGILSQNTRDAYKIKTSVAFFSIGFSTILFHAKKGKTFSPLAKFPSIVRDSALLVEKKYPYASLEQTIRETDSLIESVKLFDVYENAKLGKGRQSLALRVTYRSPDRTLTADEVDVIHARAVERLKKNYNTETR